MLHHPSLIAIVNDDSAITAMLDELLTDEGYRTFTCFSGDEAHARIQQETPDLVILDMQMEQRDSGLIVLELLRLDPVTEHIPIIMCSADGQFLREKAEHLRAHKCEILEKPYNLGELLALIAKRLEPPLFAQSAGR